MLRRICCCFQKEIGFIEPLTPKPANECGSSVLDRPLGSRVDAAAQQSMKSYSPLTSGLKGSPIRQSSADADLAFNGAVLSDPGAKGVAPKAPQILARTDGSQAELIELSKNDNDQQAMKPPPLPREQSLNMQVQKKTEVDFQPSYMTHSKFDGGGFFKNPNDLGYSGVFSQIKTQN